MDRSETRAETERLRTVADYQFGAGAGEALFPAAEALTVAHTSSGRPRQIHAGDRRLATYLTDGRFTLGVAGGRRIAAAFDGPRHRAVVGSESEPHVRDGRNAFAKFVTEAGAAIRSGDEVLVEHEEGRLLAVGRATIPGPAMLEFETGMAVAVRHGADPG